MVTYIVRTDETVWFHQQQGRIQCLVFITLGEALQFLFPPVCEDFLLDQRSFGIPLLSITMFVQQYGNFGRAIQCHPTHDFGRHELLRFAPDFPNTFIRLTPILTNRQGDTLHHLPHVFHLVQGSGHQTIVLVNQVHQITERVILSLMISIVAYAHRFRIFVTGQMVECQLRQFPLATNAIHDLVVVRRDKSRLDELHETTG